MGKKKLTIRERIDVLEQNIDDCYGEVNNTIVNLNKLIDNVFALSQVVCDLSYEMLEVENDNE